MKVYITKNDNTERLLLIEGQDYVIEGGQVTLLAFENTMTEGEHEIFVAYEEPVVEQVEPEVPAGESDIMTRDLSTYEQNAILGPLFGFFADENGDIVDDEGYSFYAVRSNLEFDLSTLAGIFVYAEYKAMHKGAQIARSEVKKALGL